MLFLVIYTPKRLGWLLLRINCRLRLREGRASDSAESGILWHGTCHQSHWTYFPSVLIDYGGKQERKFERPEKGGRCCKLSVHQLKIWFGPVTPISNSPTSSPTKTPSPVFFRHLSFESIYDFNSWSHLAWTTWPGTLFESKQQIQCPQWTETSHVRVFAPLSWSRSQVTSKQCPRKSTWSYPIRAMVIRPDIRIMHMLKILNFSDKIYLL